MSRLSHPALFGQEFRTARPLRPVYCHQEFLDKLTERRNEPVGKRASLLLQRMAVDISRLHYKSTNGVNRGGAARVWEAAPGRISMPGGRRQAQRH